LEDILPVILSPEDAARTYKRLQRWVMHLLSRKNYSRKELREKLCKRYSTEMVQNVLVWAEVNRWLMDEHEIAERTVQILHQKNKGKMYIRNYLKKRGLPEVELPQEDELEKANALMRTKWPDLSNVWKDLTEYTEKQKLKSKALRFLISRGFDMNTAQKAVHHSLRPPISDAKHEN
jgi:SOS response regulatory protein OraA/RecX